MRQEEFKMERTGLVEIGQVIPITEGKSVRSEEHTSELQSPTFISYAVFCLKKIFFNDTATTEIYTLSLHDALPISCFVSLTWR